uniref:Cystine/glutamate transporter n=1 Tax=Macrostomum lignano TaxID=282301 RepID=A0A1I8F5K6_9PLAT
MHIIRMLRYSASGAAIDICACSTTTAANEVQNQFAGRCSPIAAPGAVHFHSSCSWTVRGLLALGGGIEGAGISAGDVQNYSRICPDAVAACVSSAGMGLTETANCPDCGEFDTVRHILLACPPRGPLRALHGIPRGRELERFEAMNLASNFYRERSRRVMLVFSVTDLASFESLASLVGPPRASIGGSGATGEGGEFECCLLGVPYIETSALNVVNVQKAFVDLTLAIMRSRLPLQEDPAPRLAAMKLISQASPSPVPAKKIELRKEIGYSKESASLSGASSGPASSYRRKAFCKSQERRPELHHVGCYWDLQCTGAVCYAELVLLFPGRGGEYIYVLQVMGALPAFLVLWITFVAIGAVSNAAQLAPVRQVLPVTLRCLFGCPPWPRAAHQGHSLLS